MPSFFAWITFPAAHKISAENRLLRDALRARLKIVQRHTSITNSMQMLLAKYNFDSPTQLSGITKFQYEQLSEVERILNKLRTFYPLKFQHSLAA